MGALFALAVILWATEAIPIAITALSARGPDLAAPAPEPPAPPLAPVSINPNRPLGAWPRKMFSATVNSSNSTVS